MLRKLKWVEIDFSMTTQEPVEQVKATEAVIMTVLMMIQTTFCPTLTIIEVPLQVQAWDHVLLTKRMHHQCPGKPSYTIDISAAKMTKSAERRP
jgi:hypothetical protein